MKIQMGEVRPELKNLSDKMDKNFDGKFDKSDKIDKRFERNDNKMDCLVYPFPGLKGVFDFYVSKEAQGGVIKKWRQENLNSQLDEVYFQGSLVADSNFSHPRWRWTKPPATRIFQLANTKLNLFHNQERAQLASDRSKLTWRSGMSQQNYLIHQRVGAKRRQRGFLADLLGAVGTYMIDFVRGISREV